MTVVEAVRGDLTRQHADVLVNAANSSLLGGGGVDGALHAAAGPALLAACRRLRAEQLPDGLPVGEAVATEAGLLSARWVIHTVGPNRNAGQTDPAQLAACYTHSLDLAVRLGATSIAFPAIGAGVYGWDPATAAEVAVHAVRSHPTDGLELIRFVLFNDPLLAAFRTALEDTAQ
ncbi:O-acetyl-ADP-ribose deacetylase (regulator of RNase III) [Propionicimonas paludicola]|uniref:O-acetyl-ADP-ribose deacetylase (Regulator of RNase III) n=1 Tax=Propionicimonas paludicola TaxID=185243 RepID=A0A2A9CSI2_9ACTN|nr:O-acetyl-ADP-ribose deacetylase [Propionicimonas paludicola]PFG16590.1 O-acetyl-ADP-ribose deacetylase (regulator of RNase III) [Propionicimonas paludicola]